MADLHKVECTLCGVVEIGHEVVAIMSIEGAQKERKGISIHLVPKSERQVGCCFKLCSQLVQADDRFELHIWGEVLTPEELHDPEWERMLRELEKD